MFTVTIIEPDAHTRQVVCRDADDCMEVVRVEVATAKPWTLIRLSRGNKEVAVWGVGPRGKVARKPTRSRRPVALR
jgi:uncharacterized protein GlcG (DUF336 family)